MDSAKTILAEIANRRVLVIGDVIIDRNTVCERIKDLDDGTPVYKKLAGHDADVITLGGAALVVRNLLELGAKVQFLTGVGHGRAAGMTGWVHPNLSLHALNLNKPQHYKSRIWCNGEKVIQVDQADNTPVKDDEEAWLHDEFDNITNRRKDRPEIIVVADYRHGLITDALAAHFVERYPDQPPVLVSSQVSQSEPNHHWYVGATAFVLNRTEATAILPQMDQPDSDYVQDLREKLCASTVIVTCGAEGCLSADELVGGSRVLPDVAIKAVDACGAGDAFLAAYAVTGMLSFANLWAGLSCTVAGANPPTKEMLKPYERGVERDVLGHNGNGARSSGDDEAHHHAGGRTLFS